MRLLVHAHSLGGPADRVALAAAGLALRGHDVLWLGGRLPLPANRLPETLRPIPGGLTLARHEADVVLGGPAPLAAALAGWLVRAHCMVLGLDHAAVARWGPVQEGAWATLQAWGLVEEGEGPAFQRDAHGLDLQRVALWPAEPPAAAPDAAHPDTEVLERACERALARHRTRVPRPAVFVDRDGTLVVERGYLSDPADLELLPGAAPALRQLRAAGLPVIVISNQSGVGRGYFSLGRVYEAMAELRARLRAEGVELDGIYFCPHRPEDGCACRKPGTLLLERAAEDHRLSLRASFMIGDKRLDVETAHRAGAGGVLVRSGYGVEEERAASGGPGASEPDFVGDDLEAAAAWILAQGDPADRA